ncbi:NAD(P)H-dependent oxidoreductase [Tepidibacter hydrothermalis]|uniref:NAD(P)H-dependent oxidoreductase n=1 Tax=Tepidibacter hydrothermalis TaxID=3036126 RepID=A0ABY8EHX7_9FIRM|nr:NAD(P)H-dependent oxidoreductase [Tepidibacter hydrothermalis]WFD11500.1 NAD(P)H-dependent oxidoreductase [Tepidibacter hydrothermalis]
MNIVILNGSPKSSNSVTVQSMHYLALKNKTCNFEYLNIIDSVKKGKEEILKIADKVNNSDGIIWSFPVYHMLIPAHMKEFIEKIDEYNLVDKFSNKYCVTYSTSIHYYDHTAHDYMEGICNDFDMKYLGSLSHDMKDLIKEESQKELEFFFNNFIQSIKTNELTSKRFKKTSRYNYNYKNNESEKKIKTTKRTVIVTDSIKGSNVDKMIVKYSSMIDGPIKVVNINEANFKNYCIGCCNCSTHNECIYHNTDDYRKTLDYILDNSDIIVYACEIKDRYFSSRMKLFFDRSFCYTHIPVFKGRQIAYLVSGPVNELVSLNEIMKAYSSNETNLVGIVSDECQDNNILNTQIENLVSKSIHYAEQEYIKTPMFLSVCGSKLFSDAIKSNLGTIFLADYNYYKSNNLIKNESIKEKLRNIIFRYMMNKKAFQSEVKKNMYKHMISKHKKVLEKKMNSHE